MRCTNKIIQQVPTQYDYKPVEGTCGQTGIYGHPVYCEDCNEKFNERGYTPTQCRHGKEIDDGSFCNACEFGEE